MSTRKNVSITDLVICILCMQQPHKWGVAKLYRARPTSSAIDPLCVKMFLDRMYDPVSYSNILVHN